MHGRIVLRTLCAAGLAAGVGVGVGQSFGQETKEAAATATATTTRAGSDALIGHALSMAIESSGLGSTAALEASTAAPATSTARSASAAGSSDRTPTIREIEARNAAADARRSITATQAPGATQVEPYGSGRTAAEIEKEVAQRTIGVEPAARSEPATAPARPDPAADYARAQLRRLSQSGFEASEALFEQAARDMPSGSPDMNRFLTHARSYARILRAISQGKPAVPASSTTDNVLSSPTVPIAAGEMQVVRLVNHGVSEALDAFRLKSMGDAPGGTEAAATLRRHAQEMKADSRRLLDGVAAEYPSVAARPTTTSPPTTTGGPSLAEAAAPGASARPAAASNAGSGTARPAVETSRGNESVAMLIQEARELIQILERLD